MDKTKGLLQFVFEILLIIIGLATLFLFLINLLEPYESTEKPITPVVGETGRVDRLHDSVSNKTLMNVIEKSWEELGLDIRLDEVEQKIENGDTNYQPLRTRRVKNRGEDFRVEREFKKSDDGYYIEGTLYFITRQSYKVGVNTRYKDHEIEIEKIKFDIEVDKNETGWKSSKIKLSEKQF